jgi:cobalt/nickel transport system permease protein
MRRMRVPSLLVTTLALAYRYLFLFIDEAERMQRARAARTFSAGRSHWWHAAASVAAMLFVRATERAERIFAAMCARGWRV